MKKGLWALLLCSVLMTGAGAGEPLNRFGVAVGLPGITNGMNVTIYNNNYYYDYYGWRDNRETVTIIPTVLLVTAPLSSRFRLEGTIGFAHEYGATSHLEGTGQFGIDIQHLTAFKERNIAYKGFGFGVVPAWSEFDPPDWNPYLNLHVGGEHVFGEMLGLGLKGALTAQWMDEESGYLYTDALVYLKYYFK